MSTKLDQAQTSGITGAVIDGEMIEYSEIVFPPLGYYLAIDSAPPDDRLFEISSFSRYSYDTVTSLDLNLWRMSATSALPGDFGL